MENILFQSLIDVDTWNEARWTATAFLHDSRSQQPPYLGLVFENNKAGRRIFTEWRKRLGSVDVYEELYISIVEGAILGEDPGYSVHISSDPLRTEARLSEQGRATNFRKAVIISRFHRMIPAPDSPHLGRFKTNFRAFGKYALIPLSPELKPHFDCAIEKKEIRFRQASEITKSDRDAVVFPERYFDNEAVN